VVSDNPSNSNNTSKRGYTTVYRLEKSGLRALSRYLGDFLPREAATALKDEIIALVPTYTQDVIPTPRGPTPAPRLTCTYGPSGALYKYAGFERAPVTEWPVLLLACKERAEQVVGCELNYAFVNVYRDGKDSIDWHSDGESDIIPGSTIVSVSLGAEREFRIREIYKVGKDTPTPVTKVVLEHGSLLTMEHDMQKLCKHCVPKNERVTGVRVNITFRLMKLCETTPTKIGEKRTRE